MRWLALSLALVLHATVARPADVPKQALWQDLDSAASLEVERDGFPRIYHGIPTTAYPSVAGLLILLPDTSVGLCTGTLVAPGIIVTAAHCLDKNPVRALAAFFPNGVTEEDHQGVAYVIHPNYSPARLAYADIALLRVADSVSNVTPMPLPTSAPRPKRVGQILGFGADEAGLIGVKEAGFVRLRHCPKAFARAGLVKGQLATSLCWRPKRRGQDTCQGDSGGPLIVDGAVAGVTSGGYPDCPGVLSWDTNVALFRSWIATQLQP